MSTSPRGDELFQLFSLCQTTQEVSLSHRHRKSPTQELEYPSTGHQQQPGASPTHRLKLWTFCGPSNFLLVWHRYPSALDVPLQGAAARSPLSVTLPRPAANIPYNHCCLVLSVPHHPGDFPCSPHFVWNNLQKMHFSYFVGNEPHNFPLARLGEKQRRWDLRAGMKSWGGEGRLSSISTFPNLAGNREELLQDRVSVGVKFSGADGTLWDHPGKAMERWHRPARY